MFYLQVTRNVFHDAFHAAGRGKQFSYEALNTLFDYYSEMAEDAEGIELDVIGICCAWTEYHNPEEAEQDFGDLDNQFTLELEGGGVLVCHG